jgi:hypothetical protein
VVNKSKHQSIPHIHTYTWKYLCLFLTIKKFQYYCINISNSSIGETTVTQRDHVITVGICACVDICKQAWRWSLTLRRVVVILKIYWHVQGDMHDEYNEFYLHQMIRFIVTSGTICVLITIVTALSLIHTLSSSPIHTLRLCLPSRLLVTELTVLQWLDLLITH